MCVLASSVSLSLFYFNSTGLFNSFDTNWSLHNFSTSAFFCNSCLSLYMDTMHLNLWKDFWKPLFIFYLRMETCLTYLYNFLLVEARLPVCLRNIHMPCKTHSRGKWDYTAWVSYWNNRKLSQASAVLIMMLTLPT